jgi:fatty acid desaturase
VSGALNAEAAVKVYLVFLFWIALNQVRTLAAHAYASDGRTWSHVEQVLDSNTFDRGFLAELWAPLGMRYHALHHLIPPLPYHSLGEAHKRLIERLPADSAYRRTLRPGLWHAMRDVFLR